MYYYIVLIIILLTQKQVQCQQTTINRQQLTKFTFMQTIQINIDEQFLGESLIIEVTFSNKQQNKPTLSQFIFIAAEPDVKLPDYYGVLFQQKFQTYEQNNLFIDLEGYSVQNKFQYVRIPIIKQEHIGQWNIGFYDLKSDKLTLYNIDINVYTQKSNNNYCPNNCNSGTYNRNSCNSNQNNNNISNNKYCQCGLGYIGQQCSSQYTSNKVDEDITIYLNPLSWDIRAFNISENQDDKFYLTLTGPYTQMKMSLVYGYTGDVFVPNILYDNYDISESTTNQSEEQLPILDKLKKMYDQDMLSQINNKYPYRDKSFDKVLLVGFYNLNVDEKSTFTFKLRIVESAGQDVSGLNKSTMIMFIVFGCVIIFCVTPITYFCVKQKRKQEQDFINQIQNANNNNINNPANSHAQSGSQSQSNRNENIIGNVNLNGLDSGNRQNGILEELNQPIQQQNQINNIVQFPQNIANQIPSDRMKPIKKVVPITKDTINRFMPKQIFTDVIRLYPTLKNEGEECTVCLETFSENSECRITPCYHLFHSDCLESWFQKHSTCPYCRNSCNRKGIIQQLQSRQQNSYIQRMQQPFSKESKKQIKSDGDVEDENPVSERQQDQEQQDQQNQQQQPQSNPDTISPGRRNNQNNQNNNNNSNNNINNNNSNISPEKRSQNGIENQDIRIQIDNQSNHTNNSAQKQRSSLMNAMLEVINKPLQAMKRKDSNQSHAILKKESIDLKQPQQFNKDISSLNAQNISNNNRSQQNQQNYQNQQRLEQQIQQESQSPKYYLSNNSINRNNEININNNNYLLSINCLSQNAFIEGGHELFSFVSPNLSQVQQQPINDGIFNLNNSIIQKRFSINGLDDRRNGGLSPENSFQMVSTTRKMFNEQEQTFNKNNNNNNFQFNHQIQLDKQLQNMNNTNNLDNNDDYQISFRRYGQHSIDKDMIDNYGDENIIDNDDDLNNDNDDMHDYHKNIQPFLQQVNAIKRSNKDNSNDYKNNNNKSSYNNNINNSRNDQNNNKINLNKFNTNSIISINSGKSSSNISQKKNIKITDDPSNLPISENDQSSRANQMPLPTRNILTSQPRFFQETLRRESIATNNLTQKSSLQQQSSRNTMSFIAENIQNTSLNSRTVDDKRHSSHANISINKNKFIDDVVSSYSSNRNGQSGQAQQGQSIQSGGGRDSIKSQQNKSIGSIQKDINNDQKLEQINKELDNIKVVNKLIVLDEEDENLQNN